MSLSESWCGGAGRGFRRVMDSWWGADFGELVRDADFGEAKKFFGFLKAEKDK